MILKYLTYIKQNRTKYKQFKLVEDTFQPFDPMVLKAGKNVYLEGYWQSEKYFKEIEYIIRKDLIIKPNLKGRNKDIAKKIVSENSISLHIRRGNYVANPEIFKVHGTCEQEYYYEAIDYITENVKEPYFYIFSDEIEWAKDNFKIEYAHTFVDINIGFDGENYQDEKNYEDLRLMSLCKHNIIANSSFSWWGAWLNQNPEKIVIAPKKWFNDESLDTSDLIPNSWIRI